MLYTLVYSYIILEIMAKYQLVIKNNSGLEKIRTPDPYIRSLVLYPVDPFKPLFSHRFIIELLYILVPYCVKSVSKSEGV